MAERVALLGTGIMGAPMARNLCEPSSESASERPMLIPAPSAVARPTNSAVCEPDRYALAKIGASVETVPSISPTSAG